MPGRRNRFAWRDNFNGIGNAPSPNEDFIAVATSTNHSLGIKSEFMGTTFTYQGQLYDTDSPASGTYDFQFSMYNSLLIQEGSTLNVDDIDVIDGHFTVELDFGSDMFTGMGMVIPISSSPTLSSTALSSTATPAACLVRTAQASRR